MGLAMAGFVHVALVEYEEDYCKVLKQNRPEWNVICADVHDFDGRPYHGVDLLAGGVHRRNDGHLPDRAPRGEMDCEGKGRKAIARSLIFYI